MRRYPRNASVDRSKPRAWGTSDRNGLILNHKDMQWQYDWAGANIVKKNILVSEAELDKPQRQLGSFILPPDPKAIMNARMENYAIDEASPSVYITEDSSLYYASQDIIPKLYVTEE